MSKAKPDPEGRLRQAARTVLLREKRRERPEGEWQAGVWYPSPAERRPCCDAVTPTPSNKQALESHCRSLTHIAQLFDVGLADLKTAVRDARAAFLQDLPPVPREIREPRRVRRGNALADLLRASAQARQDAQADLQAEIAVVEPLLAALRADPDGEDVMTVLERLLERMKPLRESLVFRRTTEDAYRSVTEIVERLAALKKESAA